MAAADVSRKRADELIGWLRQYAEERIDSRLFRTSADASRRTSSSTSATGASWGCRSPRSSAAWRLRTSDFMRVLEQLAAIDLSLASIVFIHNANGIRPIVGYATPPMREELLPVLAKGRELSAFCLTEPVAGSNLPGLATVAVPDGQGGWRLRGAKRWNGSGWAGVVSVFARTAGEGGRLGHVDGLRRAPGDARRAGRPGEPHHGRPEHHAEQHLLRRRRGPAGPGPRRGGQGDGGRRRGPAGRPALHGRDEPRRA